MLEMQPDNAIVSNKTAGQIRDINFICVVSDQSMNRPQMNAD